MAHSLIRRIFVFLLAVMVTAGMGLSVVHSNSMAVQMSDMDEAMVNNGMAMPGMTKQAPAKCPDCDLMGKTKGVGDCLALGCTVLAAVLSEATAGAISPSLPIRHPPVLSASLHGHSTVPDPYPPRISNIG